MSTHETDREVYFVWPYASWGGAQIYFLSIVRNAPKGWTFKAMLPRNASAEAVGFFKELGVELSFLSRSFDPVVAESIGARLARQWRRAVVEVETLFKLLKISPTDAVCHVEAAPWQSWALLKLLSLRRKVFVTLHNAMPEDAASFRRKLWSARLNSLLESRNFAIFAANQHALDSIRRLIKPKFHSKVTLTRATFTRTDIEKALELPFDKAAILEKHGIDPAKYYILCVGQFIDRKGRWIFLEAAKELLARHAELQFIWVGPEPLSADERTRVDEFALGDAFRYILSTDAGSGRGEILRFFRVADVFVLASLWEGLPISILEAMALEIPVISTEVNAIPEAVINGRTGILAKPGSVVELIRAIEEMYLEKPLALRLAKDGKAFVWRNFDEASVARTVFAAYSGRTEADPDV